MKLPDGYVDALSDELAPYGLEFAAVSEDSDGLEITFRADAGAFAAQYPDFGVAESYGSTWPPAELTLSLRFDVGGNPVQFVFETVDLLTQTASIDLSLRDRLNTVDDPADHAVAVGEAFALAVSADEPDQSYFD
ncbi:hypothetical protein [Propionicimonas sp.]|uniref:hypothetical protein n=1 Tax=Propionicimonas sp. TaxID=1955623 RepID=UPI0018556D7F|nr:hypothetical protein [Propionicimonas sp.]MBU3975837.1 hypothetical protein [Actinomycetota bacterium]MBA3022175.1 hypothetical protein [Propionicimonas sp.]MBU3987387.1 hypothetical protein [Actinomycetota bacterium]MBU4006394.1 hypothetical protein [Actinomycetota bacterium]MBU4065273.1 hypothetical protein [Actinomycetota bacterium]